MDKMYPADDEEITKTFMETLKEKSKLPVHYGPKLANKVRHIYLPNEKILNQITHREKSYQDTPLRNKFEFDAHLLTHNQSEIEKCAQRIQSNLSLFISSKFEDIQFNHTIADSEMKGIVNNFALSGPFSTVSDALVLALFACFVPPKTTEHYSTRLYNREYLSACLAKRKDMTFHSKSRIDMVLKNHCTREYNIDIFSKFLLEMICLFVKRELSSSILSR